MEETYEDWLCNEGIWTAEFARERASHGYEEKRKKECIKGLESELVQEYLNSIQEAATEGESQLFIVPKTLESVDELTSQHKIVPESLLDFSEQEKAAFEFFKEYLGYTYTYVSYAQYFDGMSPATDDPLNYRAIVIHWGRQKMNKLVMLMGPSSVSKMSLAHFIKESHRDCVIVSYAEFVDEIKPRESFYAEINSLLGNHRYVVVDDMNLTVAERHKFFAAIDTRDIQVIGIWIDVSSNVALKQNKALKHPEDEKIILDNYKKKASPHKDEPFDSIIFVVPEHDLSAELGKSGIHNIKQKLAEI